MVLERFDWPRYRSVSCLLYAEAPLPRGEVTKSCSQIDVPDPNVLSPSFSNVSSISDARVGKDCDPPRSRTFMPVLKALLNAWMISGLDCVGVETLTGSQIWNSLARKSSRSDVSESSSSACPKPRRNSSNATFDQFSRTDDISISPVF